MDKTSIAKIVRAGPRNGSIRSPASICSDMKARQSAKLRELRQALMDAGFVRLDKQARVLELSRSTAWTVMSGSHKCYWAVCGDHQTHAQLAAAAAIRQERCFLNTSRKNLREFTVTAKVPLRLFRAQLGQLANVDRCSAA